MSEYRRGTRVVVNEDLPGVPEGTPGKCGRGLGFAIKRYRVRFDNDVEVISVAHNKLVPEDEWPQFLARRAREEIEAAQERARIAEARAAAAESRGLPAASTDEPAAEPAAEAPASEEPSADGGDADPRLAAILARSKSAREATGVPAPESSPAPAAESSADAAESSAAEPAPAAAAEPAAAAPAPATAPARSAPPSGPERVEIPEFVPGPEVDPDYAPAANRVSELISEARKDG